VLRHLFHPPVLISILAIAAFAHSWVFFSRGVAGAIHQALYTPGLLLMVLGLIFLSGIFHEFGHAAALSYGGGKVRGMGAGLYLIFPAFYTDVTDAYRLGRWARVRVDLGGFYFNLIFSLGIMGLYAITGQEFLLLVVLFIVLDILRQMLPFIRLDGYWTFADLTGIPDLFSQVGPYLRSVLPIPGWKGPRLPNLRTWVKVAFGAHIAITVPILLTLLFLMIRGIPRILATGWESAQVHISIFLAARDDTRGGD
jgi:putative peptide zinc metalloprotease protein